MLFIYDGPLGFGCLDGSPLPTGRPIISLNAGEGEVRANRGQEQLSLGSLSVRGLSAPGLAMETLPRFCRLRVISADRQWLQCSFAANQILTAASALNSACGGTCGMGYSKGSPADSDRNMSGERNYDGGYVLSPDIKRPVAGLKPQHHSHQNPKPTVL